MGKAKIKIIKNKKRHNYWGNIFRRKRQMHAYFSDAAFGSQIDTKIELYNPWEDEKVMQRFRAKKIVEYEYDENECLPTSPTTTTEESTSFDVNKVAFMNNPSNNTFTTTKNNINNNK